MTNAFVSGGVPPVIAGNKGRVGSLGRYRWLSVALMLLGGFWNQAFAQVNQPPAITITSPASGTTFTAPASITGSAQATDSDGTIAQVDVYDGTTLLGTVTSAPYNFSVTDVPAGTYTITAQATDDDGATTTSEPVVIIVQDPQNQPPTIAITSPASGVSLTAPASITGSAQATDSDGTIVRVDVYDGTTLLGTVTSAPYNFSVTDVPAGTYTITAQATDDDGATTTSEPVVIVVQDPQNQAPTVALTSPAAGASFTAPASISLTADAAESDGNVTSVAFYNGATLLGTDTAAPFSFNWSDVPAGTYSVTARATDDDGATTTSAAVGITVEAPQNQPPVIAITSPASGTTFTAPASITGSAQATDSDGTIVRVDVYDGTTLLGTVTSAPYNFSVTDVPAGTYTITAQATDDDGATTTSEPVVIVVQDPQNQAPTVALTSPAAGASFTAPASISLTADAAESDGNVTSVAFYNGATLLGTDTAAPFSFNWSDVPAGTYSVTARATDDDGATTTSAPVSVTVTAPANQAPTVALTSPTAGASFTAPANISLAANASDSDGSIASVSFYSGATLLGTDTSAPFSFSWTEVPAGTYSLTAVATDDDGATTTSAPVSVTVTAPANQAPAVMLTSPAAGASFTAPASINLTADAADADGTIASVAFYNGTTLLGTDTAAPFSFGWADVPAGAYSLTAVTTDDDGATTTSATVSITVEAPQNQAPTVALTSPAAGTSFTSPTSINLTASAADTDGSIASVAFYNGTTLLGTDTSAPYSFSWTDVPAGTYSLTAVAADDDGATTTSAQVSVSVEALQNQAPTVSLSSPAAGASFNAPASITLIAEAADTDGTIASVSFYSGATLLGTDTSAPFSFSWADVPAGTYSLTAVATDDDGATTTSAPVSVTVAAPANQAPTVTLTSPAAGASFTAPASINLTADAADADGTIASVAFYNGATLLGTDTAAPFSFNWSDVPAGTYSLTAVATDEDGATTTSVAVSVSVEAAQNQVPTVALTSPTAGSSFTAPASIVLTADSADADGTIASVAFYNGATLLGTVTGAPYSFNWIDVPAGTYSLTARATDDDGATTSSVAVSITVDAPQNQAPTVALTSPAAGASFTAPASISLTANAADTDGTIASVAFYNGTTLLGTATTAPYSFSWTDVPPGSYSLTARATDGVGATTTSAVVSITVGAAQNQPPMVNLYLPGNGAVFNPSIPVHMEAEASDPDGSIVRVEFYDSGELLGSVEVAPYFFGTGGGLPVGTRTLYAIAYDDQGAATTSNLNVVNVVATGSAPSVTLTAPSEGATFTAPASIILTADATDSDGSIARVEFYSGSIWLGDDVTAPYGIGWTNVPAGTYNLTARVTDDDNNTIISAPVSVTVEGSQNQAPTVALTSPTAGASFTAPASITLTADASDTDGTIAFVEFFNGATLLGFATSAPYSINWTDVLIGSYSVTARAMDNHGAVTTSAAVNVTVTGDNTPPTISLTSPLSGATFRAPATFDITADAASSEGTIVSVAFYWGELLMGTDTTAPYSTNFQNVSEGTYTFTARATDNLGAVTTSEPVSITVSAANIRPTVILTSPTNGAVFTAPATVNITADAADTDGTVASVTFRSSFTVLGTDTTAPYSFSWTNVPEGSYSISVTATDNEGMISSNGNSAVSFTVVAPNIPPTVSLTTPLAGASFRPPATVNITANATDPDGSVASVAFYNDATLLGIDTTAPYSFVWSNVPAGTYQITAVATDNGGATTSAAVAVTVEDEDGPSETITYIHTDLSGSPLAATNANGNVVWKENYRAYGERRLGQPGSEGQRQWFHGKEADASTGLQYFGARYYDPAVGRFMGVDPVTFQEGNLHSFNRYAYGNNNPVAYLDPDGNLPILLLIPLAVKAVDFALTGVELYGAYQTGGMSALAMATAENAAWSVVPGAKTGKSLYKFGRSAESATGAAKGVSKYEVGTFDALKSKSLPGDGLDIHHSVQKHPAGQVVGGYNPATGPSIALPRGEHSRIPTQKGGYTGSARDLLAKDIRDLRANTNAPNSSLRELVDLNKRTHPGAFAK